MAKRWWDVAVVGAGAAGLASAEVLSRAGLSVAVLEARGRTGGRIHTRRPRAWALPVELGAEFVHGRSDELFEIADAAGLLIDRLPETHLERSVSGLRPAHDFWARTERLTRRLRRRGSDRSIADFLRSRRSMPAAQKRFFASFVEGYHAAPIERVSEHALSTAGEAAASPEEHAQFRVVSSYDGVTEWLRSRLDGRRDHLSLSNVVREIRWRRGEVEIRTGGGGRFRAGRAIVTVSAGVLRAPAAEEGGLRFDPEVRAARRALAGIEMGHVVKIVLRFRNAFWGEALAQRLRARPSEDVEDIAFLHGWAAAFPTWWTAAPAQVPMITGWVGGPAAAALRHLSAELLLARSLESLGFLLGIDARRLRSGLIGWHTHDWSADPFARGAYSYQAVGGASAPAALARPIAGTIFFAGEATEADQSGTVPGAIASGRRAAKEILEGRR